MWFISREQEFASSEQHYPQLLQLYRMRVRSGDVDSRAQGGMHLQEQQSCGRSEAAHSIASLAHPGKKNHLPCIPICAFCDKVGLCVV